MKTIKEFIDWCNVNPNVKIYQLPMQQYEVVDSWRLAIAENTATEVESAATPRTIMMWLNAAIKTLGEEVKDDIQSTFDGL